MGWAREVHRTEGVVANPGQDPVVDVEIDDVPAAVVCAHCGSATCVGQCLEEDDPTHSSRVLAIVPWERPGNGWWGRLWSTARLTTVHHAVFFGSLPSGDLAAAARFAVITELLAVTTHFAFGGCLLALLLPRTTSSVVGDPQLLSLVARVVCGSIPALAMLMVFLHAVHGLALDWSAARWGGRQRLGLRFGLYSCGWDLVTLPLGLLALAITAGPGTALRAAPLGITLPTRAARSYLRGVQGLDEPAALASARLASVFTGVVALISTGTVLVAVVIIALL